MAIIYKIQNKTNGKVYIGQTKRTLDWRLNNDWCGHFIRAFENKEDSALCNALRKYGKESFIYEVLEEKLNNSFETRDKLKEWLDDREKFWISYYNSTDKNKGYNRTPGGASYVHLNTMSASERMTKYNREFWSDPEKVEQRRKQVSQQNKEVWAHPEWSKQLRQDIRNGMAKRTPESWSEAARKAYETKKKNGTLSPSKETREKIRQFMTGKPAIVKGRLYVHKGDIVRMIYPEQLEQFLADGYVKGRGTTAAAGKRYINKDGVVFAVNPEELQSYLDKGYKLGRS